MDNITSSEFWVSLTTNLKQWLISETPSILLLIIVFFIALKLHGFFNKNLKKLLIKRTNLGKPEPDLESEKRIITLMEIIKKTGAIVIWIVFLMIFLNKLSIEIGPLLAGAGIVGLAIGFGAQELVRDFISGFFILLEDQIRTGDVAILNGTGGLVEKIELRTITLRDLSGTVHVFQNGKINTISNMTKGWSAMVFNIGVAYKEDLNKVMNIMKEVADGMQNDENYSTTIIEPIEIFGLDSFGDSALVIKARIKTKPIQQWNIGREYRKRLKEAFDKNGIEIPFPHRTVYWGSEVDPLTLKLSKAYGDKSSEKEE